LKIDNIHTLSANRTNICTRFGNRKTESFYKNDSHFSYFQTFQLCSDISGMFRYFSYVQTFQLCSDISAMFRHFSYVQTFQLCSDNTIKMYQRESGYILTIPWSPYTIKMYQRESGYRLTIPWSQYTIKMYQRESG
jgi:hypothetical protein